MFSFVKYYELFNYLIRGTFLKFAYQDLFIIYQLVLRKQHDKKQPFLNVKYEKIQSDV